jgi:hypothetical protein
MHLFISFIYATCPAHLSHLNLITLMIFGEEYKACNSLLCRKYNFRINTIVALENRSVSQCDVVEHLFLIYNIHHTVISTSEKQELF